MCCRLSTVPGSRQADIRMRSHRLLELDDSKCAAGFRLFPAVIKPISGCVHIAYSSLITASVLQVLSRPMLVNYQDFSFTSLKCNLFQQQVCKYRVASSLIFRLHNFHQFCVVPGSVRAESERDSVALRVRIFLECFNGLRLIILNFSLFLV